jgi:glucosamine-6-phosphate deaminase
MSQSNSTFTEVEKRFLAKSGREGSYPGEKVKVIEVQNVYELGQIVAIAFLEYVTQNPKGVVALPTGRTPEYFIKTLDRYRESWGKAELVSELTALGFTPGPSFPATSGLTFVMLDEFFPISPDHRNAFCRYVDSYYVKPMGIPATQVLSFDLVQQGVLTQGELEETFAGIDVDLSLLARASDGLSAREARCKAVLEKAQRFCDDFEARVRALGGIGLFLGGIGPDGHIAFNQEGSDHSCKTRLVNFNYPTAAAAAGDLGGIEIARGKAAMTIGLSTITSNPAGKIVIMAAGEGKAEVVRAAIEDEPGPSRPASVLQSHAGARIYLTHGSASGLRARKAQDLSKIERECVIDWSLAHLSGTDQSAGMNEAHMSSPPKDYLLSETLVYALSCQLKVPVHRLENAADLSSLAEAHSVPGWLLEPLNFKIVVACAARRLREKVRSLPLLLLSPSLSFSSNPNPNPNPNP